MTHLSTTESAIYDKIEKFRQNSTELSAQDLNEIKIFLLERREALQNLQFFEGFVKNNKVVSCFSTAFYKDIINLLHTKHSAAIAVVLDVTRREVVISCESSICTLDCHKLCDILFEEKYSKISDNVAVGSITHTFLKLTQKLQPCT